MGIAISDDDTLARDDFYGLYHEKLQAAIDPIQKSKEHLWFKKPGERKERRAVPEGTALRFHVGFFENHHDLSSLEIPFTIKITPEITRMTVIIKNSVMPDSHMEVKNLPGGLVHSDAGLMTAVTRLAAIKCSQSKRGNLRQ